jgi:hypothetical protein
VRVRRILRLLAVAGGLLAGVAAWRRRPQIGPGPPPDLTGAPQALPERPRRLKGVGGNPQVLGPSWEPATLAKLAGWVPEPPQRPGVRALAYLWAVPMTLVGLAVGATAGVRPVPTEGVLLFPRARGPAALLLGAQGYDAITLGHVVIARRDPSPSLLAHELVHVRQAERWGALFAPAYGLLWLLYGYGRHPFERAARLGGRKAMDRTRAEQKA